MKNVSVVEVNINTIDARTLQQWAECYCEIWKEPPWLEDFWKPEDVIADFRKEMARKHSVAFLALNEGSVVGFTHGYSVGRDELKDIAGSDLLDGLFKENERLFYVDELGVVAKYRGNRISLKLTKALLRAAYVKGLCDIVLRTDIKADAARHVYEELGFTELNVHDAAYPDRTYWLCRLDPSGFMKLFNFDVSKSLWIGVERECFIEDREGNIVPRAPHILNGIDSNGMFGYELSACQIESRIGPCELGDIRQYLEDSDESLKCIMDNNGVKARHVEVGLENMSLEVYPDPSGRYQEIVKTMPRHVLLAACRVIGTHIHVGMPDHETALKAYNKVIGRCDWLCSKGNGSFGERLDIYRTVAPECDPLSYRDWHDFYRVACVRGFDEDPRKCWTLIRISRHGTIEFRMFGATSSIDRIVGWAKLCHDLCAEAMA